MTRINTNVSSLVAQNTLGRSNASLNQALTRLSTGLRINTGKDDPAGLIASENLRSDITAVKKAITNTERANQVIATADSALGQVSSLLNDIRGLVTESANTGALSPDQIAANQLQIDSSLEALNRIAQTTTFQGRKLLDGSLDFITTTSDADFSNLSNLKIDQANLGSTGSVAVDINVANAATQAQVDIANIPVAVTGVAASGTLTFTDAAGGSSGSVDIGILARAASGTVTLDSTDELTINVLTAGAAGNDVDLVFVQDATNAGALNGVTFDGSTITVNGDFATGVGSDVVAAAISAVNGGTELAASSDGTANVVAADVSASYTDVTSGGADASTETITITGDTGAASNIDIQIVEDAAVVSGTPVVSGDATNGYVISVGSAQTTTIQDIRAAIASIAEVASATYAGSASYVGGTDTSLNGPGGVSESLTGGTDGGDDVITITAEQTGVNTATVTIIEAAGHGTTPTAAIVGGNIQVTVDDTASTSLAAIISAINGLDGYSATLTTSDGNGNYVGSSDTPPTAATLAGGVDSAGGISADLVIELAGATGGEVLTFQAGTSLAQLVAGINSVSDATGVGAVANGTTLELTSTAYGTKAFIDVKIIAEGSGSTPAGTFTTALSGTGARQSGTDVQATINGVAATGDGNSLTINTATLDISTTVAADFEGTVSFTITGGGALFQLGPDVVSNQQARLGIGSVNTARLGGSSGKLYQLGTGGSASLTSDQLDVAAAIVEEAINQVTSLRGRLGAFQRTSLETNKNALSDTLTNLTDAESAIRDADFASETAALTRAQILVQSGTTVLQIANSNPQNVLALLQR